MEEGRAHLSDCTGKAGRLIYIIAHIEPGIHVHHNHSIFNHSWTIIVQFPTALTIIAGDWTCVAPGGSRLRVSGPEAAQPTKRPMERRFSEFVEEITGVAREEPAHREGKPQAITSVARLGRAYLAMPSFDLLDLKAVCTVQGLPSCQSPSDHLPSLASFAPPPLLQAPQLRKVPPWVAKHEVFATILGAVRRILPAGMKPLEHLEACKQAAHLAHSQFKLLEKAILAWPQLIRPFS